MPLASTFTPTIRVSYGSDGGSSQKADDLLQNRLGTIVNPFIATGTVPIGYRDPETPLPLP